MVINNLYESLHFLLVRIMASVVCFSFVYVWHGKLLKLYTFSSPIHINVVDPGPIGTDPDLGSVPLTY